MVVPELPQASSASLAGTLPPQPVTSARQLASSSVIAMPSSPSAAIINRVSSANKRPRRMLVPSASPARISARLVMLFDPGSVTVASSGPLACLH